MDGVPDFFLFFLCNMDSVSSSKRTAEWGRGAEWGSFLLFAVLKGCTWQSSGWLAGPLMSRAYAVPAVAALWAGLERTHATFGLRGSIWATLESICPFRYGSRRSSAYTESRSYSRCFPPASRALRFAIHEKTSTASRVSGAVAAARDPQGMPTSKDALVVQPNIDPDMQWTRALREQTEQQLTALSNALPAPLVIWPELPAPLYSTTIRSFHGQRRWRWRGATVIFCLGRLPLRPRKSR